MLDVACSAAALPAADPPVVRVVGSPAAMSDAGGNVRVVCRVRPQNASEVGMGGTPVCTFDKTGTAVIVDVRARRRG